jgi:hypothetical protein
VWGDDRNGSNNSDIYFARGDLPRLGSSLGNLSPGASGVITLTVQVDAPLTDGTLITNSAVNPAKPRRSLRLPVKIRPLLPR